MVAIQGLVLGLAYLLGLLLTAVPLKVAGIPVAGIGLLIAGGIGAIALPRLWRTGPRSRLWLLAGLVGCIALFHFQLRLPQPSSRDISHVLADADAVPVEVWGKITTPPRLTRSQRIQFQLDVAQVRQGGAVPESVDGRVYATVPLLQGTGLYPGQTVTLAGTLYRPKAAANPGGFDFQAYLRQEGMFAGISGKRVSLPGEWGSFGATTLPASPGDWVQHHLWQLRQRMVRSHVAGLGVPEGPLLSAMVMGKASVDVPYDVQDAFIRVGLAAALAASGFQVSLLIGVMMKLTQRFTTSVQFTLCASVLVLYIGLTGLEPSVARAGVMGFASLIALLLQRRVNGLGSLLLAAVLLLVWEPRWIWDLGFHLSFWATLGLLVTAPVLDERLDWLPTTIAPLISVPLAAFLWTLPLQLMTFGMVSPYCILVNVLLSPLITVISLGGMALSPIAVLYPPLGSVLSSLFYYPTHWLIDVADGVSHLPGSAIATGTISALQMLILYGLFALVWSQSRLWKFWWLVGLLSVTLVAVPAWAQAASLVQVTVLATAGEPVMVVQQPGAAGLIGSGDEKDVHFTVLPFLQKQGINQLEWAIAPLPQPPTVPGWLKLVRSIPMQTFHSTGNLEQAVQSGQVKSAQQDALKYKVLFNHLRTHHIPFVPLETATPIATGKVQVTAIATLPHALSIVVQDHPWLLLPHLERPALQRLRPQSLPKTEVLWWDGEELSPALLEAIQPKMAIATARTISAPTLSWLKTHHVLTYITGRDGAIQWTPKQGFKAMLQEEQ